MQAHGNFANCQSLPYVAVYHHALSRHSDSGLAQIFVLTSVSCTGQSDDYGLDEYRRDMADMRALIKIPPVISTKTFQEMGSQANKRPKVEVPLPQIVDASWESPTWAQVTNFNDQLPEADKGQKKRAGMPLCSTIANSPSQHALCLS